MDAVIYTSNTGTTERYAKALAEKLSIPAYSLKKAPDSIDGPVIYMGWVMATGISGLADAQKNYNIKTVCAVGMAPETTDKVIADLKAKNPVDADLFYLPGGFHLKKLSGMYRMMMGMMISKLKSEIGKKEPKSEADEKMLAMLTDGIDFFNEDFLQPVISSLSCDTADA